MEVTSASDQESHQQAPGQGHGCGRSSKPKAASKRLGRGRSCKPRAKAMRSRARAKDRMQWLHQGELDGEVTSESPETMRTQQAANRTNTWTGPDEHTSGSEPEYAMGQANMEATSMPKASGVFHYTEWLIGKLTDEQRSQIARPFTYMDLCTGLGTTLIVHEGVRQAMARRGLNINGQCTGLTESEKDRREALGRRMVRLGLNAPIKNSSAGLTDDLSDMCLADLLFMGIVCTDISSCSSTP